MICNIQLLKLFLLYVLLNGEVKTVSCSFGDAIGKAIGRVFFGDIWAFDEYCGSKRTETEISTDDEEICALYNGSIHSRDQPKALENLRYLSSLAAKARETLHVLCAPNSWGYTDAKTAALADGYGIDEKLCGQELDNLIESLREVSPQSSNSGISNHNERFDLNRWLQLNSFGTMPPGLPYRSHLWLGDYETCLEAGNRLLDGGRSKNDGSTLGTRYCFGSFGRPRLRDDGIMGTFRLGLCLPKVCPSSDGITGGDEAYMNKLDTLVRMKTRSDYYFLTPASETGNASEIVREKELDYYDRNNHRLLSIYCPPTDDSELRKLIPKVSRENYGQTLINSFLLLFLPLAWIAALLFATCSIRSVKSMTTTEHTPTPQQRQQEQLDFQSKTKANEKICQLDGSELSENKAENLKIEEKTKADEEGAQKRDPLSNRGTLIRSGTSYGAPLTHIAQSFNLRRNLKAFFTVNDPVRDLTGLNAIKVLAMNWLILCHTYLLQMSYSDDLRPFRKRASLLGAFVLNGQHAVPAFFMISGLLYGYKFFKSNTKPYVQSSSLGQESKGKICSNFLKEYLQIVITRYMRFLPMYLLCYSYIKQFGHLIGSGPLWDYGLSRESDARQCRQESWLVPLFMLANFIPPFPQCIITSWHIANDVQTFLLLPFLMLVYEKDRQLGRVIAMVSFIFTHFTHAIQWGKSTNYNFSIFTMETFIFGPRYVVDRLSYDYVNPFGRFGTYFLGVLLADLLFANETKWKHKIGTMGDQSERKAIELDEQRAGQKGGSMGRESSNQSRKNTMESERCEKRLEEDNREEGAIFKVNKLFVWGVLCLSSLFVILLPHDPNSALSVYTPKWAGYPLLRLVIEIGWALMLYCLVSATKAHTSAGRPKRRQTPAGTEKKSCETLCSATGKQSPLAKTPDHYLRLPIWNVLAKLNYSIMLTHFTLAKWLIQTRTQLIQFTWIEFSQFMLLYLIFVYSFNLAVFILIETPLNGITNLLVLRLKNSHFFGVPRG